MIPSYLAAEFPCCVHKNGITLYSRDADTALLLPAIEEVLWKRQHQNARKLVQRIATPSCTVCCKICDVGHFSSRLRISLCRKRRDGRFDRALAELVHGMGATKAGVPIPAILGYGYRDAYFGLPRETILLSEWLEGYTDMHIWMRENPNGVVAMTRQAIQLAMRLIERHAIHLDLWIGNIMIPPPPPEQ
jgi:hypothetical protein